MCKNCIELAVVSMLMTVCSRNMSAALVCETVWYEKWRCDDAEREHYTRLGGGVPQTGGSPMKTAPQVD